MCVVRRDNPRRMRAYLQMMQLPGPGSTDEMVVGTPRGSSIISALAGSVCLARGHSSWHSVSILSRDVWIHSLRVTQQSPSESCLSGGIAAFRIGGNSSPFVGHKVESTSQAGKAFQVASCEPAAALEWHSLVSRFSSVMSTKKSAG